MRDIAVYHPHTPYTHPYVPTHTLIHPHTLHTYTHHTHLTHLHTLLRTYTHPHTPHTPYTPTHTTHILHTTQTFLSHARIHVPHTFSSLAHLTHYTHYTHPHTPHTPSQDFHHDVTLKRVLVVYLDSIKEHKYIHPKECELADGILRLASIVDHDVGPHLL